MPDPALLLSFIVTSIVIVVVPGPTVTVVVANSMRHGTRAGILNVVGTQLGVLSMICLVALGLSAVLASMGIAFDILRLIGAAYLIWLGIKLWRSEGDLGVARLRARPMGSFVLQGFVVIWSNPKALLLFGALIPQFIDPAGNAIWQTVFYGLVFMVVGAVFDGLYALAAGGAGSRLSRARVRLTERIAGTFLIGGGLWLALARR